MSDESELVKDLITIINAYDGNGVYGNGLFSCQGQGMDGYTALAEFLSLARKARDVMEGKDEMSSS